MSNPSGVNGFGGFTKEAPYGSERELESLTRSAPLPATSALNEPRRAQKRASRPQRPAAAPRPVEAPTPATPQPQLAYPLQVAGLWRQVAMEPGASDLVRTIAQQAVQEASVA